MTTEEQNRIFFLVFPFQIIENVGKIVTGGELILSALISLVSTFIERIDAEAEFWLAVLSLPWLNLAVFFRSWLIYVVCITLG